jgi:hypothetical protein
MKSTFVSLLGLAILSGTMATAQSTDSGAPEAAAATAATVPFKAQLSGDLAAAAAERSADGKTRFVFTVYDRATGGTRLFEETQAIRVNGSQLYADVGSATRGGIPAQILAQHSNIYIDVARASAPWSAVGNRQLVAFKPANASNVAPNGVYVFVPVDPSLCFTCGGAWPYLVGSWSTPLPGAYERRSACGGAFASSTDTRPYLCSR